MLIPSEKTFLLDIETSGLHREKDQIISIGCTYQKNDTPTFRTFFFNDLQEEKEGLLSFLEWCNDFDTIVTFRGKGFDYPFLLARLSFHQLPDEGFLRLKLIDTEKYLKTFSSHRKQLEEMLHITRKTTSSGQDVAHLYRTYISCMDPLYKKLITLHQQDELDSLSGIWELFQMLYHLKTASIEKITQEDSQLKIVYRYATAFTTSFQQTAYHISFSYEANSPLLTLCYPLTLTTLKHPLEPIKDYYYIEAAGQLIHKSLASFIPAHQKRKARKEECFICENHLFLPLVTTHQISEKLWYDDEKHAFIIWNEAHASLVAEQVFSAFFHSKKDSL